MRKHLLFFFATLLSINSFSQISYEKAYFIKNDGQKIECLIKNIDWQNNPKEFSYILSEKSEQKTATIKEIKEFGIYNFSKFIRSNVNIDRSTSQLENLSNNRNPVFEEEELFLKVLIEGTSNLYQYKYRNLIRFFYNTNESKKIKQLIFKNYRRSGDFIGENNSFRQQLLNDLKCQNIDRKEITKIKYKRKPLVDLFSKHNQCGNSELIKYEKQKKDLVNLNLRVGLNNSSLNVVSGNSNVSNLDANFGNKLGLRLGLEAEVILPFNKNKWAVIIEPVYQNFNKEAETSSTSAIVNYQSIELHAGLRHYFFLNNNSKIFINTSFIRDIIIGNSALTFRTSTKAKITSSFNFAFGLGIKQNDKYSLELRYHTIRAVLPSNVLNLFSDYNTTSLIFGYTLF